MKRLLATVTMMLLVLAFIPLGCTKSQDTDEDAIRTLLNGSSYTDENQEKGYGSEDSVPTQGGGNFMPAPLLDGYDTIPFVRFRRFVPRGGISRQIIIDIPAYPGYPDTTALATITADIHGDFRTLFDTTTNPLLVWRKPIHDEAIRTVYLTRDENGWHIRKVSPLLFSTVDPEYDLTITELACHASSWAPGDTFRLTSPDTMLTKHDLPCFIPEDTVTVWITVETTGDSCWTFLHHGRPRWPHRWRRPYYKTGTTTFERTWYIGPEGYDHPQVRPSAHDAIGWNTLWADSSEPYVATAWGCPYIVKNPEEELPEE